MTKLIPCFICVDSGGTKTTIASFTTKGELLYKLRTGIGSPAVDPFNALNNIMSGIDEMIDKLDSKYQVVHLQLGISGLGALDDPEETRLEFMNKYQVTTSIVDDGIVAMYSVIKDKYNTGIIVLAGTGLAIYGIKDGITKLVGGWGHLLGEHGSSFSSVHKTALDIIAKEEASQPLSTFDYAFMHELGAQDIYGFKHFFYRSTKSDVASHVMMIKDWANKGNQDAIKVLEEQGQALANQVINLVRKQKIENGAILGLKGGFFTNDRFVIPAFIKTLEKAGYWFTLDNSDSDPIIGSYYIALKEYNKMKE